MIEALEMLGIGVAGTVFAIGCVTSYVFLRAVFWLVRMNW